VDGLGHAVAQHSFFSVNVVTELKTFGIIHLKFIREQKTLEEFGLLY
jgi:hypothetical protein